MLTIAFVGYIFSSCNSGVNYSDPRSVAEHALSAYHKGDWKTLRTYVNPADESKLKEMDAMIELSERYKQNHPDEEPTKAVEFSITEIVDGLSGKELNESSKQAKVKFKTEVFPRSVILEKADGKWYFERFK